MKQTDVDDGVCRPEDDSRTGIYKDEWDSLSPYAKFHFKYLGFDFMNVGTKKVYSKGMFWDNFNGLAGSLPDDYPDFMADPVAPDGFTLTYCQLNRRCNYDNAIKIANK